MGWLIGTLIGVVVLALIVGVLYFALLAEDAEQTSATWQQQYQQLDAEYQQLQKFAHGAVTDAVRQVDALTVHVLQERERGHDARLEILRLAAEASKPKQ